MSYDLNFWRYADEKQPRSVEEHTIVYHALCRGEEVGGLENLPIADVEARLRSAAPKGWNWDGGAWTRQTSGVIEYSPSSNWVRFDLRGAWTGDCANWLIDTMGAFGCPLYDPQVPERFVL